MSPRIKNASILLLLISFAVVLFKFIIFGWGTEFSYKWKYFFNLDSEKWYIKYPLGILILSLLFSISYGYYLFCIKVLDRWVDKRDTKLAFIKNEFNVYVIGIWIAACIWFFNGNFISYNYVGLELKGDTTENGTPTGHYYIVKKEESSKIARYERLAYSDENILVEDIIHYRFKFVRAGVFEGYKYDDKSYKGFGSFIICMITYFIENLIYIFTVFTLPMFIFIVFREIEYKK